MSNPLQLIRSSRQYSIVRQVVFKRDKFKCKLCGLRSKGIEAHHIIRFWDELKNILFEGLTKQQILNKVRKETSALNARNMITLCGVCHTELVTGCEMFWAPLLKHLLLRKKDWNIGFIKEEFKLLKVQLPADLLQHTKFKQIQKYLLK